MKAVPLKLVSGAYVACSADKASYVRLELPGPLPLRIIPVILRGTRDGTGCWTWNGDTEFPTLRPSILTTNHEYRCHTWVNDGEAHFLADCSHAFAGQTVPLLDVPSDGFIDGLVSCDGCKREVALEECNDCQGRTICHDCQLGEQP